MAILNVTTRIIAFGDSQISSNPRLKYMDWLRDASGTVVRNPKSEGHILQPGETKVVFDGVRATSIDGTTQFGVALSSIDSSRYRFTYTSGTNPVLRTNRNLTASGIALTFTVNSNATVNLHSASALFGSVIAGDYVFIPNTTTGDASNGISVLNSGYWKVLSVVGTQDIVLIRLPGQDFEGITETVTPTTNAKIYAYSAAGVQIGDTVDITAGFNTATQQSFDIVNVTGTFFEVISTTPIPNESGVIPTASGMVFYTDARSFLYIETDQKIVIRVNGDTTDLHRIEPIEPANSDKVGLYMRRGPTWSLSIKNKSITSANVTVAHA